MIINKTTDHTKNTTTRKNKTTFIKYDQGSNMWCPPELPLNTHNGHKTPF